MANIKFADTHNMFWSTVKAKTINGEVQLHALVDGKKIIITKSTVRRDLQLEDAEGVDCLPNSTIFELLTLMGKPKIKDTHVPQPNDPSENIADEVVHKELGDSLVRAATTASSLEAEVLDLEKTNTTQQNKIASLKRRVKKLEKKSRNLGEDASKQGRINVIDADEEITLVSVQDDADKEMFDVDALNALEALKTSKPKVKGIVFQEPGKSTTTTTIYSQQSQDKGKGIMIEEPVKPMKKKDQIIFDEETTLKLQAEFDEEERLVREKAEKEKEANIALIEEWDDIQAKIDADHKLAENFQVQEQEELSNAEKATLFQQLLEKRRKHFAAKRLEEKRNKPPIRAQ
ncbi:hypothetical protein Tco_0032528 [Tanacetum coccineum]